MATVFSRILSGEIPAYRVAESDTCFAFLDINPVARGHTLVVPKQETDYIFDLEDVLLADLFSLCRRTAKAIGEVVPCARVGVTVIGLEVPHAHVHLIPINAIGDMDFKSPKKQFSPEEFEVLAQKIRNAVPSA